MVIYNRNQIVSVKFIDETIDKSYVFLPFRKGILGFGSQKEGFYKFFPNQGWRYIQGIPKDMFKKGESLYDKSKIVITYSNNEKEIIYFDSIGQRNSYLRREFSESFWRNKDNVE